jgi:hypothetical protein
MYAFAAFLSAEAGGERLGASLFKKAQSAAAKEKMYEDKGFKLYFGKTHRGWDPSGIYGNRRRSHALR